MTYDPIAESLGYDSEDESTETQPAYHAIVHLLVPCFDRNSNPVDSVAGAEDYISETLRDQFLDWGYIQNPIDGSYTLPLSWRFVVLTLRE